MTTWTKEPTSSASPPKVAKGPKSKASGDEGGEERVVIALLRSLYLTYRFIKGTQLRNLCTSVTVT